mgnify:CR=1 FL=1
MAALRPVLMIVDDDPLITDTLHFVLSKHFEVCVAESHAQVRSLLLQLDTPPALALVDLGLPPNPHLPEEGFKVIGALLAHSPTIKIHVLSGQSDDANVKRALSLGAVDFIAKPCDVDKLKDMLLSALRVQDVELNELQVEQEQGGLLGNSLPMQALRLQIKQFADSPFPVLIEGESGSGKELVASSFHYASERSLQPYMSINCAAVSPLLAESILFGHAKGAFTGAVESRKGRFEQAHGGTLFLDEIGEVSAPFQAKLLRILQEGEFERVGGSKTIKVDVRIIAATHRDLETAVDMGDFREDLFYRLNVMPIFLPPLRERIEDIPEIARHLLTKIGNDQKRKLTLTDMAQRRLANHQWPGNVRELENCLERAAVLSEEGKIDVDLIRFPSARERPAPRAALAAVPVAVNPVFSSNFAPGTEVDIDDPNLSEKERVIAALEQAGWVQAKAARILGMTPRQIAYRIQTLNIEVKQF